MSKRDFRAAAARCWELREQAQEEARRRGNQDPGLRAGVTSGGHLDPLADLVRGILVDSGLSPDCIHTGRNTVELPGFFRPEKKWDLVAVDKGTVVAAVEFKSILGSYGNNMNNRVEEALGSATDLRYAAEADLVGVQPPWLGYVFLMTEEPQSTSPVRVQQPHFRVDDAFVKASYVDRATWLCRRLVMKRLYNAACLLTGDGSGRPEGIKEPAADLTWAKFEASLRGRVAEFLA
ncbi:MAG: hypothetical protein H5T75_01770 [Coriobacteriia bacterium]|nr:hypothetical protein [Coriobacteriia bacterium]